MAVQMSHRCVADAKLGATLDAFRNLELVRLLECRHFDFRSQRRLRHVDGDGAMQVVFVALEERMFFDLEHNVQIARRSAIGSGLAFLRHAQARTIVHARWNIDLELALHWPVALTAALRARRANDLARASAVAAEAPHRKEALLADRLAAAVTGGARFGPASRRPPLS